MKLERWDTKEVIFEMECDSFVDLLKGALEAKVSFYRANLSGANLSYSNLSYSNLSGANLSGANLRYADLRYANLSGANLISANLSGANLRYADLRYANLCYVIGGMEEVKSMQLERYMIVFTSDILCIGCQQHTIEEWWSFTDEKISIMDDCALEWWSKWKDFIFTAIEMTKDTK